MEHGGFTISALGAFTLPVFAVDINRNIIFWNGAAERLTGWTAAEVLGNCCQTHLLSGGLNLQCQCEKACPLKSAMENTPGLLPRALNATARDGRPLTLEISSAPLLDEAGALVGSVQMLTDLGSGGNTARRLFQDAPDRFDAAGLQRSMKIFSLPGHGPGRDVFCARRLGPDFAAFLLAEVSGSGMGATLFGLRMRELWQQMQCLDDSGGTPANNRSEQCVRLFNEQLLLFHQNEVFANGLLMLLDYRARELAWISAGLPPPWLFDGALRPVSGETGPPLGWQADAEFNCQRLTWPAGARLMACTDGLPELDAPDGRPLGPQGMAFLLAAMDYPRNPLTQKGFRAALQRFSQRLTFTRDITLVEIELS